MRFNRRHVLLIILLVCLIVMFSPIKFRFGFEALARIYPMKEWYLKQGRDEGYVSEIRNYRTNMMGELKTYRFERGDVAEVQIREDVNSSDFVHKGDTIGFIHSFYIENEIARLENLRDVEIAMLKVESAGEKESLISQAEQKYNYSGKQLELEKKNYNRYRDLYMDSIISEAEFEMYENAWQLAQINAEIAHNEYLAVKTGKKSQEINMIMEKIRTLEREIGKLEDLRDQYYILAPLDGNVSFNSQPEVILKITDTTQFILEIPVQVDNMKYLEQLSSIRFTVPGYEVNTSARFIGVSGSVNFVSNKQMVIAKAMINSRETGLHPGMLVDCRVMCDRVTILEYLKRGIRF